MSEPTVPYTAEQMAYQRLDIKADARDIEVSMRACLGFVRWVQDQEDPFSFIKELASLDDESRFDVWDEPMVAMIDAIMQDPNLLADMMGAYMNTVLHRSNVINKELKTRMEYAEEITKSQGKMIVELRGLVAKGKLKKFDTANKANRNG